jgi:hypothetical protein
LPTFIGWLRAHRGAVTMAGVLSFATPATLLASGVSVMQGITAADLLELMAWFMLLGLELWGLLLVIGYLLQRIEPKSRYLLSATLVGAAGAAALAEFSNGRGHILIRAGRRAEHRKHAYERVRLRVHHGAPFLRALAPQPRAGRGGGALGRRKAAQHEARRRLGQARLQAVQARIDPQLLFSRCSMPCGVRTMTIHCAPSGSSTTWQAFSGLHCRAYAPVRQVCTARCSWHAPMHDCARWRGQPLSTSHSMCPGDVAYARFPPGVLLPLLDDSLRRRAGPCEVIATHSSNDCRLVMMLPAPPRDPAVARVRSLLTDLYGAAAELAVDNTNGVASATVKVPYERA